MASRPNSSFCLWQYLHHQTPKNLAFDWVRCLAKAIAAGEEVLKIGGPVWASIFWGKDSWGRDCWEIANGEISLERAEEGCPRMDTVPMAMIAKDCNRVKIAEKVPKDVRCEFFVVNSIG